MPGIIKAHLELCNKTAVTKDPHEEEPINNHNLVCREELAMPSTFKKSECESFLCIVIVIFLPPWSAGSLSFVRTDIFLRLGSFVQTSANLDKRTCQQMLQHVPMQSNMDRFLVSGKRSLE
jgi:hypothetical protein